MANLGVDFILSVNTYENELDFLQEWKAIGGQKGATLSQSTSMHEFSYKTSGSIYKDHIAGVKEWSISADGIFLFEEDGFEYLNAAYLANNKVQVALVMPDKNQYQGHALIESIDLEMNDEDIVTYSLELVGCAELKVVPVPATEPTP